MIKRVDIAFNSYMAVIPKQRFDHKEEWLLTGFKDKAGAKRESYNPFGYSPIDSVSRQKVGAALDLILSIKDKNAKNEE